MKKIIILALMLTATLQAFAGEIKITANLTGFSDTAVVYLISGQTPIAYQTLVQGKVELAAEVSETPQNYIMYIVENNQSYYTSLFVADETIEITANKEDFPYQVKVTGSEYNKIKTLFDEKQLPIHTKTQAMQQEILALEQSGEWEKPEVQEKYIGENGIGTKLAEELKQNEMDFILEYLNTPFGFSMLEYNKTLNNQEFFNAVYTKMSPEQKQTPIGKQYLVASQSKRLAKGAAFIDINLLDKDLKAEKLSDYFNKDKKYVLVDLSSVSCPSSNQAFPITKEFADKYADKLQAVSILQSPDAATYQQFGALSTNNWSVVYAEDFMNTNAYIQYQENATPTFLLFDTSGKLVDRWTGALVHKQKLEQYFGKL